MFGIRFIKTQPTTHLMQFRRGRLVRDGAGLSFFYYAPASTLVAVPVGSQDCGFMLELVTADYQGVTVQGQVTYRVNEPQRTAAIWTSRSPPTARPTLRTTRRACASAW